MNSKKSGPSHTRVLLDSGDEDDVPEKVEWGINETYAKKYDDWRAKEEMQKLKDKYGADAEESSSSTSESEDEDAEALTPQIERDFFKTLSILKSDDPSIYDKSQKYFNEEADVIAQAPDSKAKPMFLKDYERKILVEQDGLIDEKKDQSAQRFQSTYDQEQAELKKRLTALAHDDSDDEDLLVERLKSQSQIQKEEDDYTTWLRSKDAKEDAKSLAKNEALKPLKKYWNDPSLEDGEKFLRDYLLDKKYVEKDKDRLPSYGEIVEDEHFSEEEEELEKAEEFEQKYNFRFEEPDPDFIKRFPRTMGDSLRRKDDKRKTKRDETKERKETEKERVREDIKQLKSLKRREIMQKLEKLKSVSGNENLDFGENDIDGDFDPNSHDSMMKKVFSEGYYGGEEMEKPEISDESDVDEYYAEEDEDVVTAEADDVGSSTDAVQSQPSTSRTTEEKRKRKTKVSEAVQQSKPAFDPHQKKLQEYLDEYYKLDFEDIVAGMPCRFKYRSVVPNSFGLTPEEILTAPDRELNAWCSLKKTVQHRSEEEEAYDVRAFKQKASLKDIKLKIIPSLADAGKLESDDAPPDAVALPEKKKRKRRKEKLRAKQAKAMPAGENGRAASDVTTAAPVVSGVDDTTISGSADVKTEPTVSSDVKKRRKRNKKPSSAPIQSNGAEAAVGSTGEEAPLNKRPRCRNRDKHDGRADTNADGEPHAKKQKTSHKTSQEYQQFVKALPSTRISDERLKAYGLNPKKHRAKEKYVLMAKAKTADA